ncbi:MAG: extracellular solute-binding protein [Planctomycetota bacterium]|jgi:molybdate/tungstate transport system substrate-binding protein
MKSTSPHWQQTKGASEGASGENDHRTSARTGARGDLIVFHAGSLAVPFSRIAAAFNSEHPNVKVIREAGGSRLCARKIADLDRRCDVLAVADYTVIESLLTPEHTDWLIKFASNEMGIAYGEHSRMSGRIDERNWYEILARDDVAIGRSDPNSDPCGYRAVLTIKLAEKYYRAAGLAQRLGSKDRRYIRPKETDLLALLESGEVDYIFVYRSVAEQHGLKYLRLPDQINLGNPELADLYASVSVTISGKTPGSTITRIGEPMVYAVTIPSGAVNKDAAVAFLAFLLDENKGMAIMRRCGQGSLVPATTDTFEKIPEPLKKFALECE